MPFEALDVALKVDDSFLDRANVCREGLIFGSSPLFKDLNEVGALGEVSFELLQVVDVAMLQLLVLDLDDLQVVLVRPGLLPEAVGEVLRLAAIVVDGVSLLIVCGGAQSGKLVLESLPLGEQSLTLFGLLLLAAVDVALVLEVVFADHLCLLLSDVETLLQVGDGLEHVNLLEVELLRSDDLVLVVAIDRLFVESFLSILILLQVLELNLDVVDLVEGKNDGLDDATSRTHRQ